MSRWNEGFLVALLLVSMTPCWPAAAILAAILLVTEVIEKAEKHVG